MANFDADLQRAQKDLRDAQQVAQGRWAGDRLGKVPVAAITAMMALNEELAIAWLGDSTVDGNASTGWTANPVSGGVPVGTTDHGAAGGINSCTTSFKATLVDMFTQRSTGNTLVWNAGYSGRSIYNGWMFDNVEKAIIDNGAYGTPDVCFIQPGLNDDDGFIAGGRADAFAYYLIALVKKLKERGVLPVLMACDPMGLQAVTDRDNRRVVQLLDRIKEDVADICGCVWIDHTELFKGVMEHSFPRPTSGYAQSNVAAMYEMLASDLLHGLDRWQSLKGQIVAAMFNPNVVHVYPGERRGLTTRMSHVDRRDVPSTRYILPNRQGGNDYLDAAVAAADTAQIATYVFCHGADFSAVYRMIDGDNFNQNTTSGLSRVRHTSSWDGVTTTVAPGVLPGFSFTNNIGGAAYTFNRRVDQPAIVLPLQPGLNKLSWLPGTQASERFLGNFEIWPALQTPRANGLKDSGLMELIATGVTGGTSRVARWNPEAADLSNVYSLQRAGKVDLLFEGLLPDKFGWVIGHVPRWGGGITARGDRTSQMLYRSGNDIQLLHMHTHLGAPAFSNSVAEGDLVSTGDAQKMRLRWSHNNTTQAVTLTVYDGWDNLASVILTYTFAVATDSAPIACGVAGGLYYSGTLAAAVTKRGAIERLIIDREAA